MAYQVPTTSTFLLPSATIADTSHFSLAKTVSTWKSFSSQDASLIEAFQKMERGSSSLKNCMDSLHKNPPLAINVSFKEPAAFDADDAARNNLHFAAEKPIASASNSFPFRVKDAEGGVCIKVSASANSSGKNIVELICTARDKHQLPEKKIEYAVKIIESWNTNGVWPPQFAIFDRPQDISIEKLQQLKRIPISELKPLSGSLVHDLSGEGYQTYQGKEHVKIVAPITTAKVAKGDTLMVQYGLERIPLKNNILFIDGSDRDHKKDEPEYANVGGLLREIAIHSGAKGFVVDGFIRDRSEYFLKDSDPFFCVYAKGVTPNGPTKLESGALHLPLQKNGYMINSADIFFAQDNEVFVIPAKNIDMVLQAMNGKIDTSSENELQNNLIDTHPQKIEDATFKNSLSKNALKNFKHRFERAFHPLPSLRNTPVSRELLDMMKEVPTAEYSDSYSTLASGSLTTGIGLSLSSEEKENKSAGIALIVDGTEESIKNALRSATKKHTLVIHANHPDDVVFNDTLLRMASERKIAAVVTDGTVSLNTGSLNTGSTMPVYAASYADGEMAVKEGKGKGILSSPIQIKGVSIQPGNIIVSDYDGINIVPEGLEEFGLRGGHTIASKEEGTLRSIRTGTAALRTLPHDLYPSSDPANADFVRDHIKNRGNAIEKSTSIYARSNRKLNLKMGNTNPDEPAAKKLMPRGSSGLTIPDPGSIRVTSRTRLDGGQQTAITAINRQGKHLRGKETATGVPSQVIWDNANPVIFELTKRSKNPLSTKKSLVSGIQRENFLIAMEAKAKGKPIQVNADGTVKLDGTLDRLRATMKKMNPSIKNRIEKK